MVETIEEINDVYSNATYRKDRYVTERPNDTNSFTCKCGEIVYKRTYFK